ncbi:MAG: AbrB/MazE/SpoVT family DNA-binding domain-containing protein [Deltaproteobacteria bacterium]|nr:AbrB/MazE/SpoVT family DNA-binding domain-containing protein [Deltaproteobacteria bacterium]
MSVTTMTQKGQVTIPQKIRHLLNLDTNTKLIVLCRGNEIILKPVKDIRELRGALKVDAPQDLDYVRQQTIRAIGEHVASE